MWFNFLFQPSRISSHQRNWHTKKLSNFGKLPFLNYKIDPNTKTPISPFFYISFFVSVSLVDRNVRVLGENLNHIFPAKELSIQQRFFDLQSKDIKDFILKLNITKKVYDGRKFIYSHGTAYINIFINDPPENGTCIIRLQDISTLKFSTLNFNPGFFPPTDSSAMKSLTHSMATGILNNMYYEK